MFGSMTPRFARPGTAAKESREATEKEEKAKKRREVKQELEMNSVISIAHSTFIGH